jgi:hypothetical protein
MYEPAVGLVAVSAIRDVDLSSCRGDPYTKGFIAPMAIISTLIITMIALVLIDKKS